MAAKEAKSILSCIKRKARRLEKVIFLHYLSIIRPRPRPLHTVLGPQHRTDVNKLKKIHWGHQDVQEQEHFFCEEKLRERGLFSLK